MSFPIGTIQRPNQISHSAGIITVTNLLAKIGGQTYFKSSLSRTIATDVTLVANTRYQVFAVVSGGAVQLRISPNENSVGPAGFTAWDLVASFYATGAVTPLWGTFVNVDGVPHSLPWFGGLTQLSQSGGGFITKGGTIDSDEVIYTRMGGQIKIEWSHAKTGAGGSAPGGNWEYNTNTFFPTADALIPGITQEDQVNGIAQITTAGDGRNLHVYYNNANKWSFRYTTPSNTVASNTTHPYAAGTIRIGGSWTYPVAAWDVTPIRDL